MEHYHVCHASAMSAVCKCQQAYLDEPVVLLDLSLAIHTLQVEKKLLLSLLSIESSLPSEKGDGD
jgi:ABC-type cobalamin/Fe3+-siderophores transport system ATPase subunit